MNPREAIKALDVTRTERATLKGRMDTAQAKFEKDNEDLITLYKASRVKEEEATENVRALALSMYKPGESKQVFPGAEIKVETRLEYDEETAFEWAVEHEVALALNPGTFESVVKALPKLPSFVKSYPDNKANISRTLYKVLADWEKEAPA